MKKKATRVTLILILSILMLGTMLPVLSMPVLAAELTILSYPILSDKVQYYQTFFPTGLRYSPGWYGTFSYAPPASEILLFDDDWSDEWGRCIFSMTPGVVPSGEQGGTTLRAITLKEANTVIKSYSLEASVKPFDAEIEAVMESDHFFNGIWAGEKLKQKWAYGAAGIRAPPEEQLTDRQKEYKEATKDLDIKTVDLTKFDPPRYWVGDGGNWSDNANHWSASTGGAPGASLPTSADSVYFDANSFTGAGQTVTIDAAAYCLDMDWTGATNTPTLAGAANVAYYSDVTFIDAMTITLTGYFGAYGNNNITFPVGSTSLKLWLSVNVTTTFLSDFTTTNQVGLKLATLDTNGFTMNCGLFSDGGGTGAKTLTMGASTINCTAWGFSAGGLIVTANTGTINCSGSFAGGGITTYNIVNLTGATSTISGSNTFAELDLIAGQTTTVTAGTTQTFAKITVGANNTIQSTAGNYTLALSGASNAGTIGSGLTMTDATVTAAAAPANKRYWVQDGGNWSDDDNHWSALSGFLPAGATVWLPTATEDVYFDANSFSAGSQTVTVDATARCLDMDWTGATNTPTFAQSGSPIVNYYGSLTFIAAMGVSQFSLQSLGIGNFTSNGLTITSTYLSFHANSNITFIDELTLVGIFYHQQGTVNTNGQTMNVTEVRISSDVAKILTLGASTVNCATWNYAGTNLTLTANTSTINCSGNFAGGGITTYNIVNLTGATSTISGSNTFASLNFNPAIAQTITFTDGTTQTVTDADWSGTVGNIHTLQGTGVMGWQVTKAGGSYIIADYLILSYSTGDPVDTWSYWTHSTPVAGVVGWGVPFLYINIDGGEWEDYVSAAGISVPDNGNDWIIGYNGTALKYMDTFSFTQGGIERCNLSWEYDTTFTDATGNGNDGTPSFRTTSSDANVSASITAFAPISTAKAPAFAVSDAPLLITANITATGNFTTGGVITTTGPPGTEIIEEAALAGGTPNIWIWGILAMFFIAGIGTFISYMERNYGFGGGSLMLRAGITVVVFALLITWQKFDWWMMVFYLVLVVGIMMMSRQGEVGGNVSQYGLIGFLAQSWIGMTIVNRVLEGQFITANERVWANYYAFTQEFKVFDIFSMPVLNFQFFTHGIPALVKWDYSFFGGNAQMFQYLLYSITAVVSFIIFGMIIGLLYNAFRVR